eukprot:760519-Hanusia_phi.AAC.1
MARLRAGRRVEATGAMAMAGAMTGAMTATDEKMEQLLGSGWRDARLSGEILGRGAGKTVRVRWAMCGGAMEVEYNPQSPIFASLDDDGHGGSGSRNVKEDGGGGEDMVVVETDSDMLTEDEGGERVGREGDGGGECMVDMVDEKGRRWELKKREEVEDFRMPVDETRPRLLPQEPNPLDDGELGDYIACMLPAELLQAILLWTNRGIDGAKKQVEPKELRKFFAILLGMLIQPRADVASYWQSKDVGVARACDFGRTFKMSHARWLFIADHMRFWDPAEEAHEIEEGVGKLGGLFGLFNQSMEKMLLPGSCVACGDIPVHAACSEFCGTPFAVRAVVDCASKVVVRMRVEMREEEVTVGRATTLLQGVHSSIVYADEALTSMETCEAVVSAGNHFCGAVGAGERSLQVKSLTRSLFGKDSDAGATRTFKLKDDFARPLYLHAWNYQTRRRGAPAECFLCSFPAFMQADPHIRSKQAFDAKCGIVRRSRIVPQSRLVADHHAAMHTLSLKHPELLRTLRTLWKPRNMQSHVFQLLLHIMISNAFLCFKYFDKDAAGVELGSFLNAVAFNFAEKSNPRGILQACKRKREEEEAGGEEEEAGCKPELIRNSGFGNRYHCGRCKVCPEGQKSYFFCRRCSVLYPGDKKKSKLFYICGPGTGRDCMTKHLKKTMSEG